MPQAPVPVLRVLIADEQEDRLTTITSLVESLGHEVVSRHIDIGSVAQLSRTSGADVALVGLGLDSDHALAQISAIVHEAACPVIALLEAKGRRYLHEAAKRGIFSYVTLDQRTDDIQSSLDITLQRFAEFSNLQGAFGRRAIIEQAKGILMERHGIDAETAFRHLKTHSQQTGKKLVVLAEAVLSTHRLLPGPATAAREEPE